MFKDSKQGKCLLEAVKRGYFVDKEGNAFSPKGGKLKLHKNSELTPYYRFSIRYGDSSSVHVFVHQLQAYQKFGDKIFETDTVRHLNGNSLDNSYDNIDIGSFSDNMYDIPENERKEHAIRATSFIKKYNHKEVIDYYNQVKSYKYVMNKFGITSKGTLHFILKNSSDSNK